MDLQTRLSWPLVVQRRAFILGAVAVLLGPALEAKQRRLAVPRFIKLTFTGVQDKPVASLVIGPKGIDLAGSIATLGPTHPRDLVEPRKLLLDEDDFLSFYSDVTAALRPFADAGMEAGVLDALAQDDQTPIRRRLAEVDASAFLDRTAAALPGVPTVAEAFANWRFLTNL